MELSTNEYIIYNLKSKREVYLLELENYKQLQQSTKESIKQTEDKLLRIDNQILILNKNTISIKLSDYFTEEELQYYNPTYEMLFEPDLKLKDWLDWFYEELPFLNNKHLKYIHIKTKKEYSFTNIPNSNIVKVDHLNQRILVDDYEITLPSISIYKLLSVNTNDKEYQTKEEEFQ